MQRIQNNNNTPERTAIKKELTNLPCSVKLTVQVADGEVAQFEIGNEADARNFLARLVPTSILNSSPQQVMEHISDETQPLFDFLLAEGKARNLSLPEGI